MEVIGQHNSPATVPRGKPPGNHWVGGSVGPRDCLDMVEKCVLPVPGFEPETVQPLAWSVHLLSHPDSQRTTGGKWKKRSEDVCFLSDQVFDAIGRCVRERLRGGGKDGLPACHLQPVSRPVRHSSRVAASLYSWVLLTRDMESTQVSTSYTGLRSNGKVGRI
jgi:hypothetical protein